MIFVASDGAATERVSFFDTNDAIWLYGFGFSEISDSYSSFSQSGSNVIFNHSGVQIVFYGATLADVQASVNIDYTAEPQDDKVVVSEDLVLTQDDLIAEFLDAVPAPDRAEALPVFEGFDIAYDDYAQDWGLVQIA